MEMIKSLEVDRWSEPDVQHRVHQIGMADAQETFLKLEAHLRDRGLLPGEYFSYSMGDRTRITELPDYDFALCTPNFGASEGVYLDIDLIYSVEGGKQKALRFATGKTLEEGADAFFRMSRVAAECSLMLNGRGRVYVRETETLALREEEAKFLEKFLQENLHTVSEDRDVAAMSAILEKLREGWEPAAKQEPENSVEQEQER